LTEVNVTMFSYEQYLAFWINVFNFLVVKTIRDSPCAGDAFGSCRPITSIVEIGYQQPTSFVHYVWEQKTLAIASVNKGQQLSLNDIVRMLANPPQKWPLDPRIHACLACSTLSCADIWNYAFTAENINDQLTNRSKEWLSNSDKGVQIVAANALLISPLFHIYSDHFKLLGQTSPVWFLEKYGPPAVQQLIKNFSEPYLYYFSYSAELNGIVRDLCFENRVCCPLWGLVTLGVFLALLLGVAVFAVHRVMKAKKSFPSDGSSKLIQ